MKLTRLQRYTAYCMFLAEIEFYEPCYETSDGICFMAKHIFGMNDSNEEYDLIIDEYFPELLINKPKKTSRYGLWFAPLRTKWGKRKRVCLLNKCIEETHPDNPKNK